MKYYSKLYFTLVVAAPIYTIQQRKRLTHHTDVTLHLIDTSFRSAGEVERMRYVYTASIKRRMLAEKKKKKT